MRRIRVIVVSIIIVLILGTIICLSIPKQLCGTYMVCSREGEVYEVTFDITIHRGLFKNKGLTGKIIFDGAEYTSVEDVYEKGPSGRGQFVIPALNPFDITESIYINELGEGAEYIWIHKVGSKEECSYFGPAETEYEVDEIMTMILEEWE